MERRSLDPAMDGEGTPGVRVEGLDELEPSTLLEPGAVAPDRRAPGGRIGGGRENQLSIAAPISPPIIAVSSMDTASFWRLGGMEGNL